MLSRRHLASLLLASLLAATAPAQAGEPRPADAGAAPPVRFDALEVR